MLRDDEKNKKRKGGKKGVCVEVGHEDKGVTQAVTISHS